MAKGSNGILSIKLNNLFCIFLLILKLTYCL
jgi:hypothetical protein